MRASGAGPFSPGTQLPDPYCTFRVLSTNVGPLGSLDFLLEAQSSILGKTVISQRHRSPETVYEVSVSTAKLNYGIQQRSQTTSYFGERVRPFSSHHRSHPNPAISFIVARLITTTIRSRSPISSP